MGDADATGEPLQVRCPHCGANLSADWQDLGEPLTCPKCGQPFDASLPPAPARTAGRPFQFQCLRCGSVLEARSGQAGRAGKCPSCAAVFVVPEMDARTGLARTNADPGEDGENPAPVHAYAAAGTMAPEIVRRDDDQLIIRCPRCKTESPVSANNCPKCGLPFTMEGMTYRPATSGSGAGTAAVTLGIVAIPLSFCGGVGIVPAMIAIGFSLWSWSQRRVHGRSAAIAGLVLGALATLISGGVLLRLWRF